MIDVELNNRGTPPDGASDLDPLGCSDRPESLTRMDMHCHSRASCAPVNAAIGFLDMPECYSPPEKVYDQAIARGMDLVTITDHDTIAGALELNERGFQNFIIGQEVTVYFPEDHCKLHVLVWDLTPELDEEITTQDLRNDVYRFADWLSERKLPHSFAHPLYVQNGKLTPWHLERAALLFKGWELINGAHSGAHRRVVERYLSALTPARVQELSRKHDLEPRWQRVWHKAHTGGSDDHGLLNIGRTWTGVVGDRGQKIADPREFIGRVMAGRSVVGGVGGHASLLAHQLATVASNWIGERAEETESPRRKYITSKLVRFAGVDVPRPSKIALAFEEGKRRLLFRKKKSMPIVAALREAMEPVLEKYPDLRANLDPSTWDNGAPCSQHERMALFADDLCTALSASMATGAVRAIRERDKLGIVDHLTSYLIVHAAQLPYLFSLFHQNKERNMLEKLEHEAAPAGSGVSVLERPMRVSLFTDTLGDVNGVCRFIQNVAHQANVTGRDMQVITCTGFETPKWDNVYNFKPVFATKMPKYEQLEMVLPPLMRILRHIDTHQPDVIHISTPGPVGLIGYIAAKMLRVPVLGVYHTDFPAYVDRLFDDHGFTRMTEWYMRFFYSPFRSIFTRSEDYVDALVELGMDRANTIALMPGLETSEFNTGFRDDSVWDTLEAQGHKGIARDSVKVLYVGRVSVEKNMPLLLSVWKRVHKRCAEAGLKADLVIVGDGPYRKTMEQDLKGKNAHFLGFRHGRELSTIYASADTFCFPSTTDTLGQVVMESQSSGLPVIVTDQGGPKEVVQHEKTGYVLSHESHNDWVNTLYELIANDEKRERMGADASEAMKTFDISNSFEHFWEVHTEAWHEHLATLGITPKGPGGPDRKSTDGVRTKTDTATIG